MEAVMDKKKFGFAVVAYVIVTFIVAAGWHLVLFKDVYDQFGIFTRKEPIIPLGIASMIMQALVLAYLYPRLYRGGSPVKEGVIFGLLVGVLMASIAVFAEAGKQYVASLPTWLIFESVYYLLQFGLVGVCIGLIYGRDVSGK
jgi:carbon starvation protein CstA